MSFAVGLFFAGCAWSADFSGGTGTDRDPYRIATSVDLKELADRVNEGTTYERTFFILTDDIDLAGAEWTPIGYLDATPAKQHKVFGGVFDGNGKNIAGLKIDRPEAMQTVGLFGCVYGGSAAVKNLVLVSPDVRGADTVGALVGLAEGCTVTNVGVEGGSVKGKRDVGGLVGFSNGTIENAYAASAVTGIESVGGLVGYHICGAITNSHATGEVIGGDCVGGLVGENRRASGQVGTIAFSYATGAVAGADSVGGLVGASDGNIASSYATGAVRGLVDGLVYIGGFVGYNDDGGVIEDCAFDERSTGQPKGVGGDRGTVDRLASQVRDE